MLIVAFSGSRMARGEETWEAGAQVCWRQEVGVAAVISVERSGQAPVLLLMCLWGVSDLLDYDM